MQAVAKLPQFPHGANAELTIFQMAFDNFACYFIGFVINIRAQMFVVIEMKNLRFVRPE